MKQKARVHNEWFNAVSDMRCPCGNRMNQVYSWGEYVAARFRAIDRCCVLCFEARIVPRLLEHARTCGCAFKLTSNRNVLPSWLKMPVAPTPAPPQLEF